jgi:aminoglycoside 6'-N-acetyltransferase I
VTIRPLRSTESDAWRAMRSALWPHVPEADQRADIESFFAGDSALVAVWICREGESPPLGFLELSLRSYSAGCESSPVPHVEGWYVVPDARRRGIGRMLMAAAEYWARSNGYRELGSDTQLDNDLGLAAHLKAGFASVGRSINLRKALDAPQAASGD